MENFIDWIGATLSSFIFMSIGLCSDTDSASGKDPYGDDRRPGPDDYPEGSTKDGPGGTS
jgi:hypothetical protein